MTKALAYILTIVKHGYVSQVAEKLMHFEEIQNIHELFGQYDLIIKILAENNKILSTFVNKNILSIPEIERTETLIVHATRKYMPQHPAIGILK